MLKNFLCIQSVLTFLKLFKIMKYKFPFENLNVWVLSKDLTVIIYQQTKSFSTREKYALIDQMRRASVSVSSNLAEGNSRRGKSDRIRFFNISYSSLMELISQTIIAFELGYINESCCDLIREKGSEISNKINSLINSIESR